MEILADAMPEKAAIPRSTDGIVDIMDEEADQLCGDGANSRNGCRAAASRHARARPS